MSRPIVSVITITYNHEKYIRQALKSIVSQKTNFNFEIIVADDCSTDNTQAIVEEFAHKYPDLIKPIFRKKNIGVQKNFKDALKSAKGSFIALCEGDDYWINNEKLQFQYNFLEQRKEFSICFHPVKVHYENRTEKDEIFPTRTDHFTTEDLLEGNFIQTNSVMYRKQIYDALPINILPVDWYLHLYHAQFGKIGFINTVMSVYRRHEEGVWWQDKNSPKDFWIRNGILHLRVYEEIHKIFSDTEKYVNSIYRSVYRIYNQIFDLEDTVETRILKQEAISLFPDLILGAYLSYRQETEGRLMYASTEMERLHKDLEHSQYQRKLLEDELASIDESIGNKIGKVISYPARKAKHVYKKRNKK